MITKVKDLKYKRYTLEEAQAAYGEFFKKANAAQSAADILSAREELLVQIGHYSTASELANCRFTLNTKDEFYAGEVDYYDEIGPQVSDMSASYAAFMLDTPYRAELEKSLNPRIFKSYEIRKKAFSPLIVEDSKRENALVTEYSKLMSEMKFEYDGRVMPLSLLRGYLDSCDREVRRSASVAIGEGLMKNSAELDRIYAELVAVRTEMARKMGYADFRELGYYRMGRLDYNAEMVGTFRENVKKYIVPVVNEIKEKVRRSLDIDRVMYYDDNIFTTGEAPDPKTDTKGIFEAAQKMYSEMSDITGSFMRDMLEAEAFDVESRDGKWGGGYCTEFYDYKQPFILANFNGTAADLDVITHEFGHALAAMFAFREGDEELGIGGMETAECHSMSMEFFCYPHIEKFCGELAPKYRLKHMLDALSFIPYGVIVDEFQHEVYAHPEYTPADRKALYLRLEEKYRPYLSYEGIPYLSEGTRWQYQMHIYESPFYYIDYCLAQTVAFGFLVKSSEDYKAAFDKYIEFVREGGKLAFPELIERAGLNSPFKDGALSEMAEKIMKLEEKLRAQAQQ